MIEQEIKKILIEYFQLDSSEEMIVKLHSTSLFSLYKVTSKIPIFFKDRTFTTFAVKRIDNQYIANSEWDGLQFLHNYNARVPYPIQIIKNLDKNFLIMEFIEKTKFSQNSKKDLIQSLKNLYTHKESFFGYTKNNFIGTLLQKNLQYKHFIDFWWDSRIEPMIDLAIEKKYFTIKQKNQIYKIIKTFCNDWNLESNEPRAIHGDLWSGNILFSNDQAFLIDPSVSYSHPVQDFAMLELFGSPLNFSEYQLIADYCKFKILPEMIEFFQIYPLLVHVNIFGISYKNQIIKFIERHR